MAAVSPAIGILPRHLRMRNVNSDNKLSICKRKTKANVMLAAVSGPSIFSITKKRSGFTPKCMGETEIEIEMEMEKASVSRVALDVKSKFVEVFELLKPELLNDVDTTLFQSTTHHSRQHLNQMMEYTVHSGRASLARGVSVIESYISLKEGRDLTEDELFRACVLGWCIEWFQAACLVLDDIMDHSESRRGQSCWYRLPKVGESIAIVDAFILMKQLKIMLKKHFSNMPYYMDLLDLFNQVEYQTLLGQMLDLMTANEEGEMDLLKYSMTDYNRIARYKTSYYSLYLPVACALVLAGEQLDNYTDAKDLLLDLGILFQVANDYQDCFGDPKKTGKNGTDIEDCKLSWLILQALELCSEEQKKILLEHYGKANKSDVAKVKGIYNEIDLQSAFYIYQSNNYHKLKTSFEAHSCKAVQRIGALYLDRLKKMIATL